MDLIVERVVLPLAVTAIPILFGWIVALLRRADKDRRANADASRALLYDKLKFLCEKHIVAAYMTIEDRKNLQVLHEAYHDLQGNGFIDCLYEKADQLPIRGEET